MAQALIRNIDDDLYADYREAAKRNGRSLEAELREALRVARPITAMRREAAIRRAAEIRAMTPPGVRQTPSEQLVRDDREGRRGH
jgi:plasmid stability protein